MPAQLVSLTDGPNILIDKPILLIGRHPECDIQIDSRKISRRHCCIAQVADYLIVRDLGSTNGIRINGVRVQEGRLKENDELTIGGHRFRVSCAMLAQTPRRADPAVRAKAEVQQMAVDDDERLEACDEPVPLAEPRGVRPKVASQKPPLPHTNAGPPREHGAEKSPRAPRAEPSPSHVIPEELRLAPGSDTERHNPHAS